MEIKKQMINDFQITKLGYDFMGYTVRRVTDLSFHHLIVPRRNCKSEGLGDGCFYWNGAILVQNTSHDYLHLIEKKDYDIFSYVTREMIDINSIRNLDINSLKRIRSALCSFESEYCGVRTKSGKLLIKDSYIRARVLTKDL